jgi:hypothetical protein
MRKSWWFAWNSADVCNIQRGHPLSKRERLRLGHHEKVEG